MVEAKHEFIDDNPYLVYSPDAEATASGSGGAGFPVVEVNGETGALSKTAGELVEMLANSPVIAKDVFDDEIKWEFISAYIIVDGSYKFFSFGVGSTPGGAIGSFENTRIAASADNYPISE